MVRIVVSDQEEGEAYQIEPKESQFRNLIGLEIGDQFEGEEIGLQGYKLKITGGSDEEGFPMRTDVRGEGRTRALFKGGTGYNPTNDGLRKRKTVRGNKVSRNIIQLNTVIEEKGEKPINEILGFESVEEPEEKPEEPEEAPEEKPEEATEEKGETEPPEEETEEAEEETEKEPEENKEEETEEAKEEKSETKDEPSEAKNG